MQYRKRIVDKQFNVRMEALEPEPTPNNNNNTFIIPNTGIR